MSKRVFIPPVKRLKENKIPSNAAFNTNKSDPEDEYFNISFKYYNDHLCEIKTLVGNTGRRVLKNIRTMGRSTSRTLRSNGIDEILVINSGEYSELFSRLPTDVETLKEHKVAGTSRIFYFNIDKDLYLVTIKQAHVELHK